jgi:hypothetical protein
MFVTSGEWREQMREASLSDSGERREARPEGSGEGEWGVGRNEQREASSRGETGDRLTEI